MAVANSSNISSIQILRSYANTIPTTLLDGQLAYSFVSNTLFIGSNTGVISIGDPSTAVIARSARSNTIVTQGVDTTQNTNIQLAYNQANTGTVLAQAAFNSANNVTPQIQPSFNVANSASANTIITQGVDVTQNNRLTIIEGSNVSQNIRLDYSNTAITIIQGTDVSQNARMTIIEGTDVSQNTRLTVIENADLSQNVSITTQNNFITVIQGVNVGQNSRMTIIEGTNASQNVRLDYSNTAITIIQNVNLGQNTAIAATDGKMSSGYNQANTGTVLAQAAFDNSNTKFASIGGTISGNVLVSKNLTVTGNLNVLGNTTTFNTNQLIIDDTLIYLGANNYTSDIIDIGIIGHYNPGSANAHTGIFRDPVRKEWIFFQGYVPEVEANNNIDINDASFNYANVWSNYFKGNIIATTAIVNGLNVYNYSTSSYAQANTGTILAQAAFDVANTANSRLPDRLTSGGYELKLNANSFITLPRGGSIGDIYGDNPNAAGLRGGPGGYAVISSNNRQQYVQADESGVVWIGAGWPAGAWWTFNAAGQILFPDGSIQVTGYDKAYAQSSYSTANSAQANTIYSQGVNNTQNTNIQLAWITANNALPNIGSVITVNSSSQLYVSNVTQSNSTNTGALTVNGGVGVTGNVYVGQSIHLANNNTGTTSVFYMQYNSTNNAVDFIFG
jgi:hypothetical protein